MVYSDRMINPWRTACPQTWPFQYAVLRRDVTMRLFQGHWERQPQGGPWDIYSGWRPVMHSHRVAANQVVRIVLRLPSGEFAVSDDLAPKNNRLLFGARVLLTDLRPL